MQLYNYDEIIETVRNSVMSIGISEDELNDKGLSRMFAKIFGSVLRYSPKKKRWLYYDGKVWREDEANSTAKSFAKLFSDELMSYCENMSLDDDATKKISQLDSMSKRNTIIHDAECEMTIDVESFNRNIMLFNCQNGTLDLTKCTLIPHNSEHMLSKISRATYDNTAKCERWKLFIDEIMEGDKEKADYLQRILGYCLTGDTREEKFYILYGATSRNGKSTLIETISYILGGEKGYSASVNPASLSSARDKNTAKAHGDIARLAGARMAVTSELPANMTLDTGLLKAMTGGDSLTVRHLYSSEFEFISQFKLFMNTNHLPTITDGSVFDSGRANVIEFNRHFTEQEQDKTLKRKFKKAENMSGILNWLIEGWRKVCIGEDADGNKVEKGMLPPQSVVDATKRFREDCDKVWCFLSECLESTGGNIKLKDVYEAYQKWTQDNGFGCEGKVLFKVFLEERHVLSKTGTVEGKTERNVIKGYTIRSEYLTNNPASVTQPPNTPLLHQNV